MKNVLKVESLFHHCRDCLNKETEDDIFQAFDAIGIALVAMDEDAGAEMCLRRFNYLMQYVELVIQKSVSLVLGLLSASNPQQSILDTLEIQSH